VTYYFGHALTGQGVKHLYKELMDEAELVYFLQGAPAFKGSELLKELGYFYVKQGFSVEWFKHALLEDIVEAVYVKGCNRLFVWASEWAIEPTLLGTKHRVLSFYDCLEEERLVKKGEQLANAMQERVSWREKCIATLNHAIKLHDNWEVITQSCMDWKALDEQVANLKTEIFQSITLNKAGIRTHRLLGTLTPRGAENTVDSITKNITTRLMIKGKPGTGKSSLMKGLADEANARGLDAQIIWCGLGDRIFDIGQHCVLTKEVETDIEAVRAQYKEAMQDAMGYAKRYAEAEHTVRQLIDHCLLTSLWREKTAPLFERVTKQFS